MARALHFAAAVTALYCALVLQLRPAFQLHFKHEVQGYFADGAPRWRCALGLLTQAAVLPALFAASAYRRGGGMRRWGARFAAGDATAGEWTFVLLFAAFLLLDWRLVDVRPLMAAHHAVCLAGHAVGTLLRPHAFPYYFAGVCALELGSASCNLFCMYPSSAAVGVAYLAIVSATHLATLACAVRWVEAVRSRASQAFALVVTVGLVVIRQKEALAATSHLWSSR
ncbi:hypothetical protein AB1Y20_010478 [Prymnesium parvum]|uniref:TLC domain-containing protein n=1 Tax=Prymnesium parvum TaxID=97485 RepID=A0AB34ISD8_PRYPA